MSILNQIKMTNRCQKIQEQVMQRSTYINDINYTDRK